MELNRDWVQSTNPFYTVKKQNGNTGNKIREKNNKTKDWWLSIKCFLKVEANLVNF